MQRESSSAEERLAPSTCVLPPLPSGYPRRGRTALVLPVGNECLPAGNEHLLAGGYPQSAAMSRTPLTPSSIFNFELPHSPSISGGFAFKCSHQLKLSLNKIHASVEDLYGEFANTPLLAYHEDRCSLASTVEPAAVYPSAPSSKAVSALVPKYPKCPKTDWRSIVVVAVTVFLIRMQFTVYYASLWPFLQQMDSSATATFYGTMTAVGNLGVAVSAPVFGLWCNHGGGVKRPALLGMCLLLACNATFMFLARFPPHLRKYVMLAVKLALGVAGGSTTLLQTYSAIASVPQDKSTAAAISDGAFSLGIALGPLFQLAFSPLGYPGVSFGVFTLNMYTAPAYAAAAMVLIAMLVVKFAFFESEAFFTRKGRTDTEVSVGVFPHFDRHAVALCIFVKFVQMFMYANLETIGSPYSMIVFQWTRAEAAKYNSIIVSLTGFFGFAFLLVYVCTKIAKRIDNRVGLLAGLLLCLGFQVVTYPWPINKHRIEYRNETTYGNSTEAVGCPPLYTWCASTPAVNVYFYNALYIVLFATAFPLVNVHLAAIFASLLGCSRQGTMQGLCILVSSLSRVAGPLFIVEIFAIYGPKLVWIIEIALLAFVLVPFLQMYRRLVPLRIIRIAASDESSKLSSDSDFR